MKQDLKIKNIDDLHLEIVRLKTQAKVQEAYLGEQYQALKSKVEKPVNFINNLVSWIPGVDIARELAGSRANKNDGDWVSKLFSAGSVALMNRLFLRRTGLIKRLLFSAFAQQAGSLVNKDRAFSIIKTIADLIRGSKKNNSKDPTNLPRNTSSSLDFGIPPDSEAS
jgi:hypothetical protein